MGTDLLQDSAAKYIFSCAKNLKQVVIDTALFIDTVLTYQDVNVEDHLIPLLTQLPKGVELQMRVRRDNEYSYSVLYQGLLNAIKTTQRSEDFRLVCGERL